MEVTDKDIYVIIGWIFFLDILGEQLITKITKQPDCDSFSDEVSWSDGCVAFYHAVVRELNGK